MWEKSSLECFDKLRSLRIERRNRSTLATLSLSIIYCQYTHIVHIIQLFVFLPDMNSSKYLTFWHFALFTLVVDENEANLNCKNFECFKYGNIAKSEGGQIHLP